MAGVPPPEYTVRGPNYGGCRSFDRVSVFANDVEMTTNQVKILRKQAKDYPMPPIKHYVFKMTKSSAIEGKSKMDFGQRFSNDYLNKFLEKPVEVVVNCNRSNKQMYATLKKGKKGNAMLTTGWKEVVDEFKLKKKEICIFSFRDQSGTRFEDERAHLRLVIVPLDE